MLPKRLGTSVSTSHTLKSVVLTKLDKAPAKYGLPLVLPGELGVEAGSLHLPNNEKERVTQGYGNHTQDKGKGKRVERSKSSRVMTNTVCVCYGGSTNSMWTIFKRRLIILAVATTAMPLLLSTTHPFFTLLMLTTMAIKLKRTH